MKDFQKRGNFRPGGFTKNRGDRPSFGGPKEMFDATCAKCHKLTQVPFRPNGKKPVFCRDCFVRDDVPREERDFGPRREFAPRPRRESFDSYQAPAAPSDGKAIAELRKQVLDVSAKLDFVIQILETSRRSEDLSSAVAAAVAPEAKKAKKKAGKRST